MRSANSGAALPLLAQHPFRLSGSDAQSMRNLLIYKEKMHRLIGFNLCI